MKIRKYLFAGLAVGAAVMALSGCGNKAEVRMTDYVEIHFSGLDGEGKVDAYIDKGSLKRDILAQVYEEKKICRTRSFWKIWEIMKALKIQ